MLGVERSLLGKRWRARLADSMTGLTLAQAIEVPELVGRVLAARGIEAGLATANVDDFPMREVAVEHWPVAV